MAPTKAPKLASLDKMRNRKATSSKRKRTVSDRAQPSESFEDFIFDPISMYAPLPEEDEGSDDDDEFRQGVDKKGKRRHVDCKSDVQLQGLIDSGQVDSTGSSQEEEVDSGSNSDHEEVDYQNHEEVDYHSHEEEDIPTNQRASGRDKSNSNSEDEKEISSENDTPAEYLEIHKPLVVVHDDRTYFGDRGIARGGGKRTQPAVDADSDTTLKLRPGAIARQAESYAAAQLTGRERRNYLNHCVDALASTVGHSNPMRTHKHTSKPELNSRPRVPLPMALSMLQRARERARSAKETLRETGDAVLVSSSMDDLLRTRVRNNAAADARKTDALLFKQGMNHPLRATLDRERKQLEHQRLSMSQSQRVAQRQGQRGLSMGVGTFKAGVLHVGKRDLERMAANEPARRTGSRPGGGDGARVSLEGTSGRGRKAKHGGKGKKGGKKGGGKGRK